PRSRRLAGVPSRDPNEQWSQAVEIRREWLSHALSTEPADRPATEKAIAALYSLVHRPPPEFVWVESPAAAIPLVDTTPPLRVDGPLSTETLLAQSWSDLRARLDRPTGQVFRRTVRRSVAGPVLAAMPERRALLWFGQHDADWLAHYDVQHRVHGVP